MGLLRPGVGVPGAGRTCLRPHLHHRWHHQWHHLRQVQQVSSTAIKGSHVEGLTGSCAGIVSSSVGGLTGSCTGIVSSSAGGLTCSCTGIVGSNNEGATDICTGIVGFNIEGSAGRFYLLDGMLRFQLVDSTIRLKCFGFSK